MPSPEGSPDLIGLFVAPLNALGLTYMVTGAVAATIYGEPRLTNDIDLVITLSPRDSTRFAGAFDPDAFYVRAVEVIADEARRPAHGHFNVIHVATALKADIYPAGVDPLHDWAFARRTSISVGDERVWVAPPEYVIIRKLEYWRDGGSDKHPRDLRAMVRELGDTLDQHALVAQLKPRGLVDAWRTVQEG